MFPRPVGIRNPTSSSSTSSRSNQTGEKTMWKENLRQPWNPLARVPASVGRRRSIHCGDAAHGQRFENSSCFMPLVRFFHE